MNRLVLPALALAALAAIVAAQERVRPPIAAAAFPGAPAAPAAEVDLFLQIDGVPGESTDASFKNWCDIAGFSFGEVHPGAAAQAGGAGGKAEGRAQLGALTVTKRIDAASPRLFLLCARGDHLKSCTLVVRRRSDGSEVVRYVFGTIVVGTINVSSAGSSFPTEDVAFHFTKIEMEYRSKAGGVKAQYDVKTAVGG